MIFHDKSLWYKFMWQLRQYFVVSIDCDSYTTVGCVRYASKDSCILRTVARLAFGSGLCIECDKGDMRNAE